jgi:two-component system chemotaxis response regulator CheB
MIRILIVDDSALMRKMLSGIFNAAGDFEVAVARDGLAAIREAGLFHPDVVTLDINMPGLDGLACLDRLMLEHPVPVVMLSSMTETGADVTLKALAMGAVDFVAKPEGVASLTMAAISAELVEKVRAAAAVKMPRARRLAERMRLRHSAMARPSAAVSRKPALGNGQTGLVLVGTSTGGPPALDVLLSALPAGLRWPVVIAQHMPASFTGSLAHRLDQMSALSVSEILGPTALTPGSAYIAHGGADTLISTRAGQLIASTVPIHADYPWHPSVDRLVHSALQVVPPADLLAVLLTGMGSDGAAAIADLRAAGGHTIAEARDTAVVWGMPGELVHRGGASEVLPLHDIARRLSELLT